MEVIFVSHLSNHALSLESLRGYFGKFGEIADSVIMCNKQTGEPRCVYILLTVFFPLLELDNLSLLF